MGDGITTETMSIILFQILGIPQIAVIENTPFIALIQQRKVLQVVLHLQVLRAAPPLAQVFHHLQAVHLAVVLPAHLQVLQVPVHLVALLVLPSHLQAVVLLHQVVLQVPVFRLLLVQAVSVQVLPLQAAAVPLVPLIQDIQPV